MEAQEVAGSDGAPPPEDRLWSVEDVSHYLGVPVATLYGWRSERVGPPGARVGRHVRYRPAAVRAWVAALDGWDAA